MLHERYSISRKLLVVVMAVNEDENPLVMTRNVDGQLANRIIEVRRLYREKYGI